MHTQVLSQEATSEAPSRPLVIDLGNLDASMLVAAGGKAANLGELIRAGLPVPPGFCVTTEAYTQVAEGVEFDFDSFAQAEPEALQRLATQSRAAILGVAMPPRIAEAIAAAYENLGHEVPVAVRSSATAEDLPHASFAGQQDTYLNVTGTAAVLDAVQRCWASLWTGRAVVYRATNGIAHSAVRLAVVVQRMIQAETAGVMFTANPVTGRRQQAVIDASPGLGEAVVSGAVNPDRFVLDSRTGEILERRLGDKRFEVRPLEGGGTAHVEHTSRETAACVTDDQLRSLAALGGSVEAHYGAPQDTEWAIDGSGAIWLTQSRPITTLYPLPASAGGPERRVYFCFSVAQGLYRPITPMGLAAFRVLASAAARLFGLPVADPLAGPSAYAEAGQRVFIDLTNTLRSQAGRTVFPRLLDVMEARSAAVLRQLIATEPGLSMNRPSWLPFVRRALCIAHQHGVPLRILHALFQPESARARVDRMGAELVSRLKLPASATATQRLDFVERVLATEVIALGPSMLPFAVAGFAMLGLAAKLLGDDATPDHLEKVLRGLPHNVTTEMDLALWTLAEAIRKDQAACVEMRDCPPAELSRRFRDRRLPPVAQYGLSEFLEKYGHRAVAEIDLGMPRWSDDPTHIIGVLANYLRLENPNLAPDAVFARSAAEAQAAIETLAGQARDSSALRSRMVRFALTRVRQLAGLRESAKYHMVVVLAAVRRELSHIGRELERRGTLASADDVFFLDLVAVRQVLNGSEVRRLVVKRREEHQLELRRRHVPNVLLSDGAEPEIPTTPNSAPTLTGTPASSGQVTGTARVILDPVGAKLEPGEILVAPSTDPGWTPLFLTAGGLVMEMGGANSHGAVVAREYGIPAVVGVRDATRRIQTGDRITLDGGSGSIAFAEEAG